MPSSSQWTDTDAEVCGFLKVNSRKFDAESEFRILECEREVAEWRLEHARKQAFIATTSKVSGDVADDHDPDTHPTTADNEKNDEQILTTNNFLAPIDISGLLPPPRVKEGSTSQSSAAPMESIKEESEDTEETAKGKVEKKSKSQKTDERKKKAKARADEPKKIYTILDEYNPAGKGP